MISWNYQQTSLSCMNLNLHEWWSLYVKALALQVTFVDLRWFIEDGSENYKFTRWGFRPQRSFSTCADVIAFGTSLRNANRSMNCLLVFYFFAIWFLAITTFSICCISRSRNVSRKFFFSFTIGQLNNFLLNW